MKEEVVEVANDKTNRRKGLADKTREVEASLPALAAKPECCNCSKLGLGSFALIYSGPV